MMTFIKKNSILGLVLIFVFSIMSISAFALENGTYEVDTKTYYFNPDTGVTDDGGTGNAELGEGMCRSAVFDKAIVEKSDDGVKITMRMLLYSNLSDIRFAVQQSPNGVYDSIKYSVIKQSASTNSADIQFETPSEDSYIQVKMYVGPMGRDVCFYWNCDMNSAVPSNGTLPEVQTVATSTSKFIDINGHWAEKDIEFAVEKGLFNGTSDITFSPDVAMSRGMFVTVLGRLSEEDISGNCTFVDVDNSAYYAPYIAWANKNNIVNGTSSTNFEPDSDVTVEQAAAIIMRYVEYKGIQTQYKSISPSMTGVSDWAKDVVGAAGKAGIITKNNTNGWAYTSSATRACVASMLSNLVEFYIN